MMRTVRSRKPAYAGHGAALSVLALVAGRGGRACRRRCRRGIRGGAGGDSGGHWDDADGHLMLDQMGMTGATMPATLPAGHPAIGTSMGGGGAAA